MEDHYKFLKQCAKLAKISYEEGESPVGSVIVRDGIIIGEGSEKSRQLNDITRHAEVVAMLDALNKTNNITGATLYSNVEPCILCSYAIRHYNLKQVVFSKHCGELGGTAKPFNILTSNEIRKWGNPPEVIVLAEKNS